MKILAYGDVHLHSWPRFSRRLPNGMESRTADGLNVLRQIRDLAAEWKPDVIVNLGDTTHRQHAVRFKLYNPLTDLLAEQASIAPLVITLGNHDIEGEGSHSLHPFSKIPNVTVVDEGPAFIQSAEISVVPYSDDPVKVTGWVDGLMDGYPLVAHYGAEGAPLESDYWLDSPLKLDMLRRFPMTLFGHIHKPSVQCAECRSGLAPDEIAGPCAVCHAYTGRVIYVGAPMHFDFGDAGARSVLLCDTRSGGVTRAHISAPRFVTATWPRVPAETQPQSYLRILNVPRGELDQVKRTFLDAGWLDVVPVPADLTPQTKAIAAQGLAIKDTTVADYVRQAAADQDLARQKGLVEDGERWLNEARR
jgi:hypothetical protein